MKKTAIFFTLCSALLCFSNPAASEIYKWQDATGKTHYGSKPPAKGARPADLPHIMRAEVKVPPAGSATCDKHGGINCQLGPDSDGSVICYDGFKGASGRFRFSCAAPKLEITDISDLDDNGGFSVFVRNSKSVKAEKVTMGYLPEGGREVKLQGPVEIEPFGVAEFRFQPLPGAELLSKPGMEDLRLNCGNCP